MDSSGLLQPRSGAMGATSEDVRACYHIFLGRAPENEDVIHNQVDGSIVSTIRKFISSFEYKASLDRAPEPVSTDQSWRAFVDWATTLPISESCRARLSEAASREALARILLTDIDLASELLDTAADSEVVSPPSKSHTNKIRLINELASTQIPDQYNSLGPDPYMIVERSAEAGYLRVKYQVTFPAAVDPYGHSRYTQIFLATNDGISDANSWTLDAASIFLKLDTILYSFEDVRFVRIDPTNQPGSFKFEDFDIWSISPEEAKVQMFGQWRALLQSDDHSWRTAPLIAEFFHPTRARHLTQALANPRRVQGDRYAAWIAHRQIDQPLRSQLIKLGRELGVRPKFSVLMPTYNSDLHYLELAVQSVLAQTYDDWQLCIVDDGSTKPEVATYLTGLQAKDDRIRIQRSEANGGIARATNKALSFADGEFIALLDHDDELAPHALFAMAHAINQTPEADFLYSDEDKITEGGVRFGPLFKPDWSPEFMLGCMYTCHLGVYRTALVREIGGFRPEFDLAQDYDLAFRVSTKARAIVHVPDVLYHWRILPTSTAAGADAKPSAELAARRAVQAHRDDAGRKGRVVRGPFAGSHRVLPNVDPNQKVSIVIPSAARRLNKDIARWYLLDLVRSIFYKSTHRAFEIVVVHNGDMEPELEAALRTYDIVYVDYDRPVFNIAEKMNLGVARASAEVVLLLNDDMTVISGDWLEQMLMWLDDPEVAGVGAKLFFPSGTIQHAGVLLLGQGPGHVYYDLPADTAGLAGSGLLVRNYSALTGACFMCRKADYEGVGGFDTRFRLNYNDVDFCLRLRQRGRLVYTPFANLYHYESVSREPGPPQELIDFNQKWGDVIGSDPMYNRNLSQNSSTNEISLYPRPMLMDYTA